MHKTKLLIVDTSPSMAQVLKTFAELHNYDADVYSDSAEACAALANRFSSFAPGVSGGGYDCVLLGWPNEQITIIADLLGLLGSVDNSDLPLIVLSEEPNNDAQTLARRRAKTRTLLWRDHNRIEGLVEGMVVKEAPAVASSVSAQLQSGTHQPQIHEPRAKRVLLVDDTPSVCHALRDMLESNGYRVTIANSASAARSAVEKNHYDLLLTEFFLREESGEDLCRYLNSLPGEQRIVKVVMTRKILDSVVQRSFAVGAVACLDKSESTEILFARLDAIAKGLSPRVEPTIDSLYGKNAEHHAVSGLDRLVQLSVAPTVFINDKRIVVAANAEAARVLAAGDEKALPFMNFEETIHGASVKRSSQQPIKALFRNLDGESLSVVYRSRVINGAEYGLQGDICMLTFESVDEDSASASVAMASTPPKHSVLNNSVPEQVQVSEGKTVSAISKPAAAVIVSASRMEQTIEKALVSTSGGVSNSLLMIDIKMVAAITGDRLSLGRSKPLLEMVRTEFARRYTRADSLAWLDDGKFVLFFQSGSARQAYALAENLVALVPKLIIGLSDILLVSHAAFIELPRRSDISARYLLKHCAAACLKNEIEGLDNRIFDINAKEKLPPRRSKALLNIKKAVGIDLAAEGTAVSNAGTVATS